MKSHLKKNRTLANNLLQYRWNGPLFLFMSSCQTNIWGRILNTQITEVVAGKPDSFTWIKPGFELHINISADFNLKSTMLSDPLFHMVRFFRENPGAAPSPWYILDL